jgi:hypothetical protein
MHVGIGEVPGSCQLPFKPPTRFLTDLVGYWRPTRL